jgi:hypothetical protein
MSIGIGFLHNNTVAEADALQKKSKKSELLSSRIIVMYHFRFVLF